VRPAEVRAALMARGLTYADWAKGRGYAPRTVTQAVARHAGREPSRVRGLLTWQILLDLSREIGQELVAGILTDAR
jgi:hypothetical protein